LAFLTALACTARNYLHGNTEQKRIRKKNDKSRSEQNSDEVNSETFHRHHATQRTQRKKILAGLDSLVARTQQTWKTSQPKKIDKNQHVGQRMGEVWDYSTTPFQQLHVKIDTCSCCAQ
jgi:hypothetical protein